MLEKILRWYSMSMATDSRSPLLHLVGPPGCGKSTLVRQAAEIAGVKLHTINLSRVSPLELEGVQMPHGTDDAMKLKLLHATFWTQLREGDILLFDEFLRAFPEVMNGLLDIITAREVGGLVLPRVFFIAASNSVVTYDQALEDRLLNITVPDPRKLKSERTRLAELLVSQTGMMPDMTVSLEMEALLRDDVLPMFDLLDHFDKGSSAPGRSKGRSIRHLTGQVLLREVVTPNLRELVDANNLRAIGTGKWQYMLLLDGKHADPKYVNVMHQLRDNPKLTPLQRRNTQQNIELVELASIDRSEEGVEAL